VAFCPDAASAAGVNNRRLGAIARDNSQYQQNNANNMSSMQIRPSTVTLGFSEKWCTIRIARQTKTLRVQHLFDQLVMQNIQLSDCSL
jgi:hypothetical protein